MAVPMMPKATAVWLVDNTTLTFKQIADFCRLHELEIQAIADGEVVPGMTGMDPVASGQITPEELDRCLADEDARLELKQSDFPMPQQRTKGARYTPIAKRQDKPDGIAWFLRHHPELSDAQIGRLLGTTKSTINAVRDRTHWNTSNIRPRDPVELGLCNHADYIADVEKARKKLKAQQEKDGIEAEPILPPEEVPAVSPTALPLAGTPGAPATAADATMPYPPAKPVQAEPVASEVFATKEPAEEKTEPDKPKETITILGVEVPADQVEKPEN